MALPGSQKVLRGETRSLLASLVARITAPAAALTPEGVVLHMNPRLAHLLEVSPEAMVDASMEPLVAEVDRPRWRQLLVEGETRHPAHSHLVLTRPSGKPVYGLVWVRRLPGHENALVLVVSDLSAHPYLLEQVRHEKDLEIAVAERTAELAAANAALTAANAALREANDALAGQLAAKEAALADNETLMREVHHRTKNNLQMLADLLYLKADATGNADAKRALEDAYTRVFAFARLHEQLYLALYGGRVRFGAYLEGVIAGFRQINPGHRVTADVSDAQLELDVDRTVHAGLIVNELVTNAFKHAFPDGRPGQIAVRLRTRDERLELQVQDDGVGLPPDFDLARPTTLGLRLVEGLVRRLGATLSVDGAGGATFTLSFPIRAE